MRSDARFVAWHQAVFAIGIMAVLCSLNGAAQRASVATANESPTKAPTATCGALRALTGYEFSVDDAILVPAEGDQPELCRVQGQVLPEVRFEVSLPTAWNGRLFMTGNGGYAGQSFREMRDYSGRKRALARGFAVVQTNTGHDAAREPLAAFASHSQKLADFAYRGVHVSLVTAKRIVRAYYDSAPSRAYFDGCSNGGRQGLVAAQRFPEDFDGVSAGAPLIDFVGTFLHWARVHQLLAAAPLSEATVRTIAEVVYKKCDAVDGLSDGLISDPRQCRLDPTADLPRCAVSESGPCLSHHDAAIVDAIYGDLVSNGRRIFPGVPVGAEVFATTPSGPRSGWDSWLVRADKPAIVTDYMETFFTHMATPGTAIDWRKVDVNRDLSKLEPIGTLLSAMDPDLSAFRRRGGKILVYFGWADAGINPLMATEYYDRVREKMGADTTDFFRLFMMPGVFHCGGGVGPNDWDRLTPLVEWVERGVRPDRVIASLRVGEKTVRTRPLCPYPLMAKYRGHGSIDDAASFVCMPSAAITSP